MRPRGMLGAALLAAATALAAPSSDGAEAASSRDRAVASYREGRYAEAARIYQEILAAEPRNADLQRDLMWVLWKSERYDEAVKAARRVQELRPGDPEAAKLLRDAPKLSLKAKAKSEYQAGRYPQAAELYEKLAEEDPKDLSVLRDWMWTLWETEKYAQAEAVAQRILRASPRDKDARDMLKRAPQASMRASALAAYREGRHQDAANLYAALSEQDPRNPGLLKDLFWARWQTEDYDGAQEAAERLTAISPKDPEAWNLLARTRVVKNDPEGAIKDYKRSLALKPDQPDTRRMVGRLHVDMREFDKALSYLENPGEGGTMTPNVYPQLAKAQFFQGHYAESAVNWKKAVALYPDNDNYKIHEARALFYGGKTEEALKRMERIAAGTGPMRGLAIDFLVDEALRNRGPHAAARTLEERLSGDVPPADEPRLLRLAALQADAGETGDALRTLRRYEKQAPPSVPALLLKAGIYNARRDFARAAKAYRDARTLNPSSVQAIEGQANAELALGLRGEALKTFKAVQKLDPTNPYLVLRKSFFVEAALGERRSRKVLEDWLAANEAERAAVPILLYHGITPFENDPLLAHNVHLTTTAFDDQMRGLKEAGYTPVTADEVAAWYAGKGKLPEKPVLITFDDGRLDSFVHGDPSLKRHGMKATMFIIMANVEGNLPPSYVSWAQIGEYRKTGRWEFQAHGDEGHNYVDVDAEGRRGMFLLNKKWLPAEKRLETVEEWKQRIAEDHKSVKRKIAERLGKVPTAYAFPEGAFGQIGAVNSPEAADINLEAARAAFKAAFQQDVYGINARSRDPMMLARVEPDPRWSGRDLVKHLQDRSPRVMMRRRLLQQSVWADRPREAYRQLAELKKDGASQTALLGEEGRVRSSLGDVPGSWELLEKARAAGHDEAVDRLHESVRIARRPAWTPSYTASEDNKRRRSSGFAQVFRPFPGAKVDVGLVHALGRYSEKDRPDLEDVRESAAGLDISAPLGGFHRMAARVMYHRFRDEEDGIPDNYTAAGAFASRWSDAVRTELRGGRALYDTARALNAEVTEDFARFDVEVGRNLPAGVLVETQAAELSDGNRRYGAEPGVFLQLSRSLKMLYRYTFSHMERPSENYYSPQRLEQHQLGLLIEPRTMGIVTPSLSYMPGTGKEEGIERVFIENIDAGLRVRLGRRGLLEIYYGLIRTPTYRRNTYNGALTVHF